MLGAIGCVLEVIQAGEVTVVAFVVVSKLDDEVVACTHLALDRRPISSPGVETAGVGTGLTSVVDSDESRIEERSEVHTPTAFVGGRFVILRHRRIADGVNFDCGLHHRQAKQHSCEEGKDFFHDRKLLNC